MAHTLTPFQVATNLLRRKGIETTPQEMEDVAKFHLPPSMRRSSKERGIFIERNMEGHRPHTSLMALLREYQYSNRE